jgi:putative endonuclease
MKKWYLYIVKCSDDSLYTGITTDIDRRVVEHNASKRGAKYTRSRRPVALMMVKEYCSRALAASAEARVKSLTRKQKLELIKVSGVRSDKTEK